MLNFEKPEKFKKTPAKKSETSLAPVSTKIAFIEKVIKGETYLVMNQSAVEMEDEFSSLYWTASSSENLFLQPPFNPNALQNLVITNNVLNQCVEAMEVNIDGTGHEFVAVEDGKDVDEAEKQAATGFFTEPYPMASFVSIRRKLRRQVESIGYSYLEILRNVTGQVVGVRNVETAHVRMVKLDAPVLVTKTISRGGKDIQMQMWVRERRFAQMVALKDKVYYKEYGASRDINRETGFWGTKQNPVPKDKLGSELLMFGVHPDIQTPYYLPRWINELPSVIGSRNAEEQNLQFLDAGGLPPAIIFVQGGTMAREASDQLRGYLSGQNKNKNRAVVVEVAANSGSLDSQGKVDVKTERFGSQEAQDAMFKQYDETTEEHVREGFRLPPLFLGKAADYNFATAQTAYMVAEAQVFGPERTEFDEVINKTIIKELGFKTLRFKSKPITLKDVATQIQALTLAQPVATRQSFIKEVNTAAGMNLELAAMPAPNVAPGEVQPGGHPAISEIPHEELPASTTPKDINAPQPQPQPEPKPTPNQLHAEEFAKASAKEKAKAQFAPKQKVKKSAIELIDLVHDYATVKGLVRKRELSEARKAVTLEMVEKLSPEDAPVFNRLLAQYTFGADSPDLIELVGV